MVLIEGDLILTLHNFLCASEYGDGSDKLYCFASVSSRKSIHMLHGIPWQPIGSYGMITVGVLLNGGKYILGISFFWQLLWWVDWWDLGNSLSPVSLHVYIVLF